MGIQDKLLVMVYCLMLALSAMMAFWIFVFPSTFRASPSNDYGKFLEHTMNLSPYRSSLMTKYKNHPAVQYLHILPAGAWTLSIPLQLTPVIHKSFPKLHKLVGWTAAVSSVLLFISVFAIHHRKLDYLDSEYAIECSAFLDRAAAFPTLYNRALSFLLRMVPSFTAFSAVWFMVSIVNALRCIARHDVQCHKVWMVRHVGSGLGVAVQRCFVLGGARDGLTPTAQMLRFTEGIYVGFALSVAAAEVAVRCMPGGSKKVV